MRASNCAPVSSPPLPSTYNHPMWQASLHIIVICSENTITHNNNNNNNDLGMGLGGRSVSGAAAATAQ
jgi:hypothetical protein